MLRIDIEPLNTVATLYCSGHLIFGVEVEMLRTMVQSRPEQNIRIDLSDVNKIDASGLGLLVELRIWAGEARRTLTLIDLSEHVWRLVILTKLYAALEISYSDVPATGSGSDDYGSHEMIAWPSC
jgi:ABC-type transporter Mla MlaB component